MLISPNRFTFPSLTYVKLHQNETHCSQQLIRKWMLLFGDSAVDIDSLLANVSLDCLDIPVAENIVCLLIFCGISPSLSLSLPPPPPLSLPLPSPSISDYAASRGWVSLTVPVQPVTLHSALPPGPGGDTWHQGTQPLSSLLCTRFEDLEDIISLWHRYCMHSPVPQRACVNSATGDRAPSTPRMQSAERAVFTSLL